MNDSLVMRFHRAAGQRIAAAKLLATAAESLDAIYLGGYGLECSLKSIILARTIPSERRMLMETEFRGDAAHKLDHLVHDVELRGAPLPPDLIRRLRRCAVLWYVEMRYETGR